MPRKRANGEGGLFELKAGPKKGWWRGVVDFPPGPDGKRRRRSVTRKSKTAAAVALRKLINERDTGSPQKPEDSTIEEWLLGRETIFASNGSSNEWIAQRKRIVKQHLIPHFDGVKLSQLAAAHVEAMLSKWAEKEVGMRTREVAFRIFRTSIETARSRGIIRGNPFHGLGRPKSKRTKVDPYTAYEMRAILTAAKDDPFEALWTLAFSTGMRIGEILALSPRCLDLDAGRLTVERTGKWIGNEIVLRPPKTERSRRVIDLPTRTVESLVAHRKRMLAAGKAGEDFVFLSPEGAGMVRLSNLRRRQWHPLLKRAKVAMKSIHQIRHTYATLQLLAGVPVPVVSAVLGHASPSITLDIYSHYVPAHQGLAKESMDRLFSPVG